MNETLMCAKCGNKPVPAYRKKYCDECSEQNKREFEAKQGGNAPQNAPSTQKLPIQAVNGTEGMAEVKHLFQSQYEFGPAGNRHTIKYYSIEELKTKLQQLKDEGLVEND